MFNSVYVDLKYIVISHTFTAGSVCLCGVMHVLLFVLHVCMLRECGGARVTAMLVWGGWGDVVVVSAGRFTNSVGTGEVLDVCMCLGLRWCRWGVGRGLGPGYGMVGWFYVCVRCESGLFVYMAGPGICIVC